MRRLRRAKGWARWARARAAAGTQSVGGRGDSEMGSMGEMFRGASLDYRAGGMDLMAPFSERLNLKGGGQGSSVSAADVLKSRVRVWVLTILSMKEDESPEDRRKGRPQNMGAEGAAAWSVVRGLLGHLGPEPSAPRLA